MPINFRLIRFKTRWLLFFQALLLISRSEVRTETQHKDHTVPQASSQSHHEARRDSSDSTDRWSMEATLRGDESIDAGASEDKENKHGKSEYDWSMKLDESGKYLLHWKVLYQENKIIFALNINQTDGRDAERREFRAGQDIFALGFSRDGHLNSSDFCIVWYDLAHRIHLQDARTDSVQRLELIDGSRSFCSLISGSSSAKSRVVGASHEEEAQPEEVQGGDRGWQRRSVKDTWMNEGGESEAEASLEVEGGGRRDAGLEGEERGGEREDVEENYGFGEEAAAAAKNLDKQSVQIVFSRPLDVCSRTDYYQIDNGTTHLVWFSLKGPVLAIDGLELGARMGLSKGAEGADNNKLGFGRLESGFRRVQLIASGVSSGVRAKESHKHRDRVHEVRMKEFSVPARDTVYWCKLFRLPRKLQTRKHHITSYEALIEPATNEHIVHHMELFHCATNVGSAGRNQLEDKRGEDEEEELASLYKTGGWAGECKDPARPPATESCKRVLLAWAMGARPLIYPEQVGQAIGGAPPQSNFGQFVMLEVHYNNPGLIEGLVDSSGLRFHYTHQLRPNEAGVMEVGLEYTDKNSIPAGVVAPLAGYCTGECTRVAIGGGGVSGGGFSDNQLDTGGVYVFAGQMHTHLAGVASWTEHYRAGKLLGELQRDNHYSPHFQEIRLLPKPVRIEPGDTLVHYCLYDTRHRNNVTLGGFATTDEMCVTYLHYYPKIDLEVCKSSVDSEALEDYFEYLSKEEAQSTGKWKPVSDNYRAISWSARRSRELLEFYAEAPLSVQCNRSNGNRFAGSWTGAAPTRLWAPPTSAKRDRPLWRRQEMMLNGAQIMEYRGPGHGKRHAQCEASSTIHGKRTSN